MSKDIRETIAPLVDTTSLLSLARRMTREQFVTRFPHPFISRQRKTGVEYGADLFESDTLELRFDTAPDADVALTERMRFVAVVPRAESPYVEFIFIGRAQNCDLILEDRSISRVHAHFVVPRDGSPWLLTDDKSANGTFVNGQKITPPEKVALKTGDVIRFGDVRTRFIEASQLYDLLTGQNKDSV